jgi:hypothetical protein
MLSKAILQNYLTTLFGILAGLPILVAGSGLPMTPRWTHILLLVSGLGTVGLGIVAKAFNTHSTLAQTEASQASVLGQPNAPALVKAADAQVEAKK